MKVMRLLVPPGVCTYSGAAAATELWGIVKLASVPFPEIVTFFTV